MAANSPRGAMNDRSQALRVPQRGLRCVECGGVLEFGRDLQLLHCTHCTTAQLQCEGAGIEALAPVGRLGRRRVAASLRQQLNARGLRGHVVRRARLRWLPFWHVEGRLVAWTRYYERVEVVTKEQAPRSAGEELHEESLARPVQFSAPACELRGVALLGVAFRLGSRAMRPLAQAASGPDDVVCAVLTPPSMALRQAEATASRSLLPRRALRPLLRCTLIRTRLRLIYYPVWLLDYELRGQPYRVALDGLSGTALGGTLPRRAVRASNRWLAASALAGWLAGMSLPLAAAAWLGFGFWRLRADSDRAVRQGWWAWWSGELSAPDLRSEIATPKGEA
jgi:hypothetical protein